MKGYRDDETNTTSVSATGSGNINIEWALIYKHEYRKMEHGLNGAVYVLTDRNGNPIVYPATAKSASGFTPGQPVTFTTSRLDLYHTPDGVDHYNGAHNERDGYAWVFLDKEKTGLALQKGITYYFKELTPPPGYQRDNTIFNFTIAEHPDYDDYEYYSGDVLRIADSSLIGIFPRVLLRNTSPHAPHNRRLVG